MTELLAGLGALLHSVPYAWLAASLVGAPIFLTIAGIWLWRSVRKK